MASMPTSGSRAGSGRPPRPATWTPGTPPSRPANALGVTPFQRLDAAEVARPFSWPASSSAAMPPYSLRCWPEACAGWPWPGAWRSTSAPASPNSCPAARHRSAPPRRGSRRIASSSPPTPGPPPRSASPSASLSPGPPLPCTRSCPGRTPLPASGSAPRGASAGSFTPDAGDPIHFQAGDALYFAANSLGTWDIRETVRKTYLILG